MNNMNSMNSMNNKSGMGGMRADSPEFDSVREKWHDIA